MSAITEKSKQEELVDEFIKTLDPLEQKALMIARDHLESSFDILKSIGFIEFKKKNVIVAELFNHFFCLDHKFYSGFYL